VSDTSKRYLEERVYVVLRELRGGVS